MGRINEKYIYKTTPKSKEQAIVKGDTYRFTILCDRLIRMEYNKNGVFEDRATQTVINRNFSVPEFSVSQEGNTLIIATDYIEITYHGGEFTKNSLSARFTGKLGNTKYDWHYGDSKFNLKGTARTLDKVDGECELEDGIMSRVCMTTLDDSNSLILSDDGWIDVRDRGGVDIYLFGYRNDYKSALKAYCQLTGTTPMIPRYALGNWWSRFYKYTQEEYCALMNRFKREGIPFSVAVIDMDWHYTDIAPEYGSGWTGFSWNKELFPDHCAFLKFLNDNCMHPTLNLHPAEGIAAHEDCYEALASAMGIDATTEKTVAFDIANPKFVENYFDKVLHPMEKEGVAFWWMDWQQGNTTKVPGLDPLWMLNHYHYIDMQGRNIRPMIFSRYAGTGSQRYPIGFSGDTVVTWESLDFQPYFTATASNIGYGWWSHDIGGHMFGYRDDEMVTRWVELGVFSPIMRLHSMCSDFQSKEPWNYNMQSEYAMRKFLRLRHSLIPYMYTMNYRAYSESIPMVAPVYYECDDDEAYTVNRNEYFFGTQMLVSPITHKSDSVTAMGSTKTYLPEGVWFDFFTGRCYSGKRTVRLYRELDKMPVLVKGGGIVPMDNSGVRNGTDNPKSLLIHIFPGANGEFTLYEDDGVSTDYENGICVKTKLELRCENGIEFNISAPCGEDSLKVKDRGYTLAFRSVLDSSDITVTENGTAKEFIKHYDDNTLYIEIKNVNSEVSVYVNSKQCQNPIREEVFRILKNAQCSNTLKEQVYNKLISAKSTSDFVCEMTALDMDFNLFSAIVEVVTAYER